jgi:hypothetical protein
MRVAAQGRFITFDNFECKEADEKPTFIPEINS